MPRRPTYFKPTYARPSPLVSSLDAGKVERSGFYNSARWRRLRAVFLAENPVCVDCLALDIVTPATTPHHIEERLARPDRALDPSNLLALCTSCHSKRHKTKGR